MMQVECEDEILKTKTEVCPSSLKPDSSNTSKDKIANETCIHTQNHPNEIQLNKRPSSSYSIDQIFLNSKNNGELDAASEYYCENNCMSREPSSLSLFGNFLQKTMTTGSKAMRTLGNNTTSNTTSRLFEFNKTAKLKKSVHKKAEKRLLFKNGTMNVSRSNIDKRRRRYLTDIFTTLIDLKWRYNLGFFAAGFFLSWTFFAMAWYFISYIHDDFNPKNLENPFYKPCIMNVSSFSGAMLFSIETQQTIGYGLRVTTEKCAEAILIMMIQSAIGVMLQSLMVGIVFAKLSRPKKRSETLMFSKACVINLRDGRLCLMCRVADMRKSHIVEAHVRMYLIKKKVTLEGEIIPLHIYDLNVGWDKGLDRLFLIWPLTIEHYIDNNSPFWNISSHDLKNERFEIAVILEGIVESTGMTTQARTSYLASEVSWGHRFDKLVTFEKDDGTYKIDYSRFNSIIPVDTPACSARELEELKENVRRLSESFSISDDKTISESGRTMRKRHGSKKYNETNNEKKTIPDIVLTYFNSSINGLDLEENPTENETSNDAKVLVMEKDPINKLNV